MSRSEPRPADLPLLLLLHRPYRCRTCDRRSIRFRPPRLPLPQMPEWWHPCLCERWEQHPVGLRWFDLPALLFLRRPYRCKHCLHRFYGSFWY